MKDCNELPKIVKVTTTTYTVEDVAPENGARFNYGKFHEMAVKHNLRWHLSQTKCLNCEKPFKDEDYMYLIITDNGNQFLCQECAQKFRIQLGKPDYVKK
jgi:predicted metal-binding protein